MQTPAPSAGRSAARATADRAVRSELSYVGRGRSRFDDVADRASRLASRASFFVVCLILCALWLPSYFLLRDVNTWQLVMVTVTNVATFLLVALLQNAQWRSETAINKKLDALAESLAAQLQPEQGPDPQEAERLVGRLVDVIHIEERVSPSDPATHEA